MNSPRAHDPRRAEGHAAAQAAHRAHRDRDRPRRRDDHGHVRPHRLDQGGVRRDLHLGLPGHRRHRHRQVGVHAERATATRPRRRSLSRCCRRCAPCRMSPTPSAASAGSRTSSSTARSIVFGGAPNLGFSVDPTQPEFNSLTLVDGRGRGRNEVVIDQATANKKDLAGRPDDRHAGERARPADADLRARALRRRGEPRRRDALGLRSRRRGSGSSSESGKLDQIRAKAKAGRVAGEARRRDPRRPAAGHAGADRRSSRRSRTRRTPRASSTSCRTSCSRSLASRCSSAAS